jgi:hypothetical protein
MNTWQQKMHDESSNALNLKMLRSLDDKELHLVALYIRWVGRFQWLGPLRELVYYPILRLVFFTLARCRY